jgi:hypothetical protein
MIGLMRLTYILGLLILLGLVMTWSVSAEEGPPLEITEPRSNLITNTTPVRVSGITDANITVVVFVESSWFRDDPENAPRASTLSDDEGRFSVTIDIMEGFQKIFVNATAPSGASTEEWFHIALDTSPHVQTINQPPESPWYTNADTFEIVMTVQCECVPELTTVNGVEIPHPGVARTTVHLEEGENKFRIITVDRAQNYWMATIVIIKETVPPVLTVDTLDGENVYTNETPVVLTGFVSGANEPVMVEDFYKTTKTNRVNGSWADGARWEFVVDPVYERQNLTVVARDRAGNVATHQVTVHYDTDPPALDLDVLPAVTNKPYLWINGSTEEDIEIMWLNGIKYPVHYGVFEIQAILLEGDNQISVTVEDLAGNRVTQTHQVHSDRHRPTMQLDIDGFTTDRKFHVRGTTDSVGGTIYINGEPYPVTEGEFDIEITLSEGFNLLNIVVVDEAGNRSAQIEEVSYMNPWLIVILVLIPMMIIALLRWYRVRVAGDRPG